MSTNLAFTQPYVPADERSREDDRHLARYAFNAGPDIDLSHFSGSQFVGDFPGEVLHGRRLHKIPEARANGPYEYPAQTVYGDSPMGGEQGASFLTAIPPSPTATPTMLRGNNGSRMTRFVNPPKVCAYMLMRRNESRGLCLFENVKGWSTDEVLKAFGLFWPVTVAGSVNKRMLEELGWEMEREVMGITVHGPFLDQIREHLKEGGLAGQMLKVATSPGSQKGTARDFAAAKQMIIHARGACEVAWASFNGHLNNEESAIMERRQGKPGKRNYDLPDSRFMGGVLPLDIQALANTNRSPIDERQIKDQTTQMEANNSILMRGFELMGEKLAGRGGLSREDLDAALAARDKVWEDRLAALGVSPTGELAKTDESAN